jgi:primosomal protein N' (replication factor Y)
MTPELVAVALPLPFQEPFTYTLPRGVTLPPAGCRVQVPFGGRRVIGVATGPGRSPGAAVRLRDVTAVLDEEPLVEQPLLDLASWVSGHYLAPPGECFRLVMPPAGIRASRAVVKLVHPDAEPEDPVVQALQARPLRMTTLAKRLGGDPRARVARLRRAGLVEVEQAIGTPGFRERQVAVLVDRSVRPRGSSQAQALEALVAAGGRAAVSDLARERASVRGALRSLAAKGAVRLESARETRSPAGLPVPGATALDLNADQDQALAPILEAVASRTPRPILLHGVTGSGKTEVYFRAIEAALGAGRGALVLVPEIALTPLLVRAATARFGNAVSLQHSELSAGERHDQWWRIREGEARVVVGARSAVFAPVPDLGLIVVDEEHDGSYKQDESPRYHGRDVAVVRAQLEGCAVILGSATPSVESHTNVLKGKYAGVSLPRRIADRPLPRVEIVDRREMLKGGGDPILGPALQAALVDRLDRREQSLVLLNRRGYATCLLCRECGQQAECPNCSVSLTLHLGGRRAVCHYCGHDAPAPEACAACRGPYLRLTGYGTQKVVEAVRAAVPDARVERLDRDRASRRGVLAQVLARFEAGELDVLVGTQMIAKGHDFPRVTLVGVVDADVGLGLPDFRSAERTFQLLTQVSGRAGRGDTPGEVILQSHLPDHYALTFACTQDYRGFYEREMEFRRTMGYPPVAALVNVVIRAEEAGAGARAADGLARRLRSSAAGRYRVLGPAHAPLARLRNEHRFQVLLKGNRPAMRDAVRGALGEILGPRRWPKVAVDIDPLTVM